MLTAFSFLPTFDPFYGWNTMKHSEIWLISSWKKIWYDHQIKVIACVLLKAYILSLRVSAPSEGVTQPFHRRHLRLLEDTDICLCFITVVKLQLWRSNEINFIVGVTITWGRLRTTGLTWWLQWSSGIYYLENLRIKAFGEKLQRNNCFSEKRYALWSPEDKLWLSGHCLIIESNIRSFKQHLCICSFLAAGHYLTPDTV